MRNSDTVRVWAMGVVLLALVVGMAVMALSLMLMK